MAPAADFAAVTARLRSLLEAARGDLVVTHDTPAAYTLAIAGRETTPAGFVAGIRVGRRYVSYYLMPVYGWPSLLADISPALRRRMQGKACFNFTAVDEALFAELGALTQLSIERYRSMGWQAPGRAYV